MPIFNHEHVWRSDTKSFFLVGFFISDDNRSIFGDRKTASLIDRYSFNDLLYIKVKYYEAKIKIWKALVNYFNGF